MLERPEALTLARQLNTAVIDQKILTVRVEKDPHKMAWLNDNRQDYQALLIGQRLDLAVAYGGQVELQMGNSRLSVSDGVNVRLWSAEAPEKVKHQLALELESGSTLTFSVQMYGGISAYLKETNRNPYYLAAKETWTMDDEGFTLPYFTGLARANSKLSLKALLTTEQRIPGLGNGVLQDILFYAKLHPKVKVGSLSEVALQRLYKAIRETTTLMVELGGRNVEMDLFGNPGGYQTIMSKTNASKSCPSCGTEISKENYMGGSIYYCPKCQVPSVVSISPGVDCIKTRRIAMTEFEKMHSGKIYNCEDEEVMALQMKCLEKLYDFNATRPSEFEKRTAMLKEMFAEIGDGCYIEPPLRTNWGGRHVHFGHRVYANFNLTLVDDTHIYVGDYTLFGPNVVVATAAHPITPDLRMPVTQYNLPVSIGKNCWIGAGVIIVPGVNIGDNTVIGAGSVVTKDLPANVVAVGNPCKVIRPIGEADLAKAKAMMEEF